MFQDLVFLLITTGLKQLKTSMASSVIKQILATGGVHVPPELLKNHFPADNLDFMENTPDGKRTFHGTVLVVYQSLEEECIALNVIMDDTESPVEIPESIYQVILYPVTKVKNPTYTAEVPLD